MIVSYQISFRFASKGHTNLCTHPAQIKYAKLLFWPLADPPFPGTFHQAHSNQPGKQRHIVALHENPDTQGIN